MMLPKTILPVGQSGASEIVYEASRAAAIDGWWTWAMLIIATIGCTVVSMVFYRRDAAELARPVRTSLMLLRLVAVVGLILFFLDITRRTRREVSRPSELAILVDTSQSMSLPMTIDPGSPPRMDRVEAMLDRSKLAKTLSSKHRTSVYATSGNGAADLLASISDDDRSESANTIPSENEGPSENEDSPPAINQASAAAIIGLAIIVLAMITAIVSFVVGFLDRRGIKTSSGSGPTRRVGQWILATAVLLPLGITLLGIAAAVHADRAVSGLFTSSAANADQRTGQSESLQLNDAGQSDSRIDDSPASKNENQDSKDELIGSSLSASLAQSRLGDAIRSVLSGHDPSTLAGVVVLTDGQNNGGINLATAGASARRSEVMVVPVGLGTDAIPTNVRVVDVDAPRRVYPGDKFVVTATLQASGSSPITVDVELLDELEDLDAASSTSGPRPLPTQKIQSKQITLSPDSTLSTLRFEVEPEQIGRRRLAVRVVAPSSDQNQVDDARDSRYEVVAKKLKVLTIAGGPTREYRFVRNLLYRDDSVQLDVFLQTGRDGMSQDADNLLDEVPSIPQTLFDYDAIVMFDPDWTSLELSTIELLDRYVAQQAGGLVLIAGPVFHDQWIRRRTDPRVPLIAGFFPVAFSTGSPIATGGRAGGSQPWPLELTDEAARADFMDIVNDPAASIQAWNDFSGVYDYVSVKSVKPAAKVYAYFSDPTTQIGGSLPVFLASQFYGAGRVVFAASGEMWRLRGEEEAYFDAFYTKLVRWVAQGRLQRDGKRGVLLVDNSRAMVGDTITLRAILVDEKFEPLTAPQVIVKVLVPGGGIDEVVLTPVPGDARPGTYGNRYVVRRGGDYEFRLTTGDALNEEILRQNVSVRLPTIELERPQRNDQELLSLAKSTGGFYIPIDQGVTDEAVSEQLLSQITPQPQITILPGTPDNDFARRRNAALLWLIASVLTMEWIVRRLHRLA